VSDILEQLNNKQREAVEALTGPVMVIAGAGSGKTRVLTYRVAHLLNQGVDPFNILALTFTNKASREMKERIIRLVGNADAKNVWMGTFHSLFARVLRSEAYRLGFPSHFSIYDTDDTKRLIKTIIKNIDLDDKIYSPGYIANRISGAKANLITAEAYNSNDEILTHDKLAGKPFIGEIYKQYKARCFRASAMDFDDLLLNTFILLESFPDVLLKYQMKFNFILVDEYQDTNHAQYMILKKLAARDENICVVGDDAQSIYGFRGANIQNILNFKRDYPDALEFKLEQNYRSTQTIVNAANTVIIKNKDQIYKEIWTENEEGNLIELLKAQSDNEEGTLVANSIFGIKMNEHVRNDTFAVLYRTNAQSRSIEEALRRLNIPYRIYGGLSFYNRKEIKDLLAYFRLSINHNDEEALKRIINYPARGIGKTSQESIIVAADQADKPMWEVIDNPGQHNLGLNSGTQSKLTAFVTMIKSFSAQVRTKNAFELAKLIAHSSGIMKDLNEDKTPEGISRYENIEELLNAIKEFSDKPKEVLPGEETKMQADGTSIPTLDEFMQDVALLTDADVQDKDDGDKVSLMTIHAAKGLEFPYVFIVGLEENLFPSIQSLGSRADLEEERRLFYVALTRAQKKVTISYAQNRYRWGNLTLCEPSRFIDEIDRRFVAFPSRPGDKKLPFGLQFPSGQSQPFRKNLKKVNNLSTASSGDNSLNAGATADQIIPGIEVEHARFGKGKVISVEGSGQSRKASVFFRNVGQKQLLLQYARLKIVE
jgi:DNA helicase-2/ATP-dependent DNA helicase PcrA